MYSPSRTAVLTLAFAVLSMAANAMDDPDAELKGFYITVNRMDGASLTLHYVDGATTWGSTVIRESLAHFGRDQHNENRIVMAGQALAPYQTLDHQWLSATGQQHIPSGTTLMLITVALDPEEGPPSLGPLRKTISTHHTVNALQQMKKKSRGTVAPGDFIDFTDCSINDGRLNGFRIECVAPGELHGVQYRNGVEEHRTGHYAPADYFVPTEVDTITEEASETHSSQAPPTHLRGMETAEQIKVAAAASSSTSATPARRFKRGDAVHHKPLEARFLARSQRKKLGVNGRPATIAYFQHLGTMEYSSGQYRPKVRVMLRYDDTKECSAWLDLDDPSITKDGPGLADTPSTARSSHE